MIRKQLLWKKSLLFLVTAALLAFAANYFLLFRRNSLLEVSFTELFLSELYEKVEQSENYSLVIRLRDVGYLLIGVLMTASFTQGELNGPGIYLFLRRKSRGAWSARQLGRIFCCSFLYQLGYLGMIFFLLWIGGNAPRTEETAAILLYTLQLACLQYGFAVFLNALSCVWGTVSAALTTAVLMGIFLFAHIRMTGGAGNPFFRQLNQRLNPFSVLADADSFRMTEQSWGRLLIYGGCVSIVFLMAVKKKDVSLREVDAE